MWILFVLAYMNNGLAINSVEFSSKEKCEVAKKVLIEKIDNWYRKNEFECFEKWILKIFGILCSYLSLQLLIRAWKMGYDGKYSIK